MSKQVDVALDETGIRNILHNEAAEPCKRIAQQVASGLDPDLYRFYEVNTAKRAGGGICTVGLHGIYHNRKYHDLEKAVGSAKE